MGYDELVKELRSGCGLPVLQDKMNRAADAIEGLQQTVRHQANILHHFGGETEIRQRFELCHELFADVKRMEKELPRWISVKERLPKMGKTVFLITDGRDVGTGWYEGCHWWTSFADIDEDNVTHWQTLPTPPKEEEA